MKNIKNIAKQIHEILKTCSFDDVTDSSGCFIIKKFKNGTERFVDVYKSTNDGNPHYVIYCRYEDEDINYKYTKTISLQELENVLNNFYMEENYMNENNKINEFDPPEDRTKEFEECSNAMRNLSITSIIKAVDYINELSTFIPSNNEVLDYLENIVEPLVSVIDECRTDKECPHCGCYVFKSDLPQYNYVCAECDENFDECEVK